MYTLTDGVRQTKRVLRRLRVRGRVRYLNATAALRGNSEMSIRWESIVSVPKKPLKLPLLNLAYRKIEDVFGSEWFGFTNVAHYYGKEFTPSLVKMLQSYNPPEEPSINFICLEGYMSATGHTILASYDARDRIITLFDSGEQARKNPVLEPVERVLKAHYGHIVGAKAGYSQGFCVQKDNWTCAYRSIYACLALLHGKNPEHFHPKIMGVFNIAKMAVEDRGIRLEAMSLEEIWKQIARKKTTLADTDDCNNDL